MNKSEPIVFVVDDDEAVCRSLSVLIEQIGLNVQTYESARDFLDNYDPAQAGCLVLDIRMSGMNGLELQSMLVNQGICLPIIIISGHGDVPMAVQAMKKGAVDFLEKPFRDQVLLDSIQNAIRLDSETRQQQAEKDNLESKVAALTPRQQQIMELLIKGESGKKISYELGISRKTVDFHRAHILEKMGVETTVELSRLISRKLVPV